MSEKWHSPETVWAEYKNGAAFKAGIGKRGLYDQAKMNERFFVGDQWHGAQCGEEKPLISYNIIKRIGDYKMAVAGGSNVAVSYSAEGVPNTQGIQEAARAERERLRDLAESEDPADGKELTSAERITLVMAAMSDYFKVTAERVKFDDLKNNALRKAYTAGTGVIYTYWDPLVRTGLYADVGRTSPIRGDLRCEVLDVENVYFGDPNLDSVQDQPFIIVAQRKRVDELKRAARRNRRPKEEIDAIHSDRDMEYMAGDRSEEEDPNSCRATVLTKFYKKWNDDGDDFTVMAVEVVEGAVIRAPWDIRIRCYPLAKISWETRANCVYGDSEVTHLIPNQIAINRAITAAADALVKNGMPIMLVDGDAVPGPVTNEPGQIIRLYGDPSAAIRYVQPPAFMAQYDGMVNSIVSNTMTQSGANEAALGDMRPDNAAAIMATREAATRPMQLLQNRFYSFVEDIARIWAEFWVTMYGRRALKVEDETGEWYLPFDGDEYKDLLISARVDVGAGGLWSEIQSQQTLDNLLINQIIDPLQYLERIPKGSVPDLGGLIRAYKEKAAASAAAPVSAPSPIPEEGAGGMLPEEMTEAMPAAAPEEEIPDMTALIDQLPPEYQQAFAAMPPEVQKQVLESMMAGA